MLLSKNKYPSNFAYIDNEGGEHITHSPKEPKNFKTIELVRRHDNSQNRVSVYSNRRTTNNGNYLHPNQHG